MSFHWLSIKYSYVLSPDTPCSNGDIRLVDGLISTEGRVEVCMDGRWTGICDSSWNYQDAFVVCRQLGYPATGTYVTIYTNIYKRLQQLRASKVNQTNKPQKEGKYLI